MRKTIAVAPVVADPTTKSEDQATAAPVANTYAKRYSTLPATAALGTWLITVVGGPGSNPKRGASKERFALYHTLTTPTVEAALAAGVWRADLRWDLAHGLIMLAPPQA